MYLKGSKLIINRQPLSSLLTWFPALFYFANLYRMTNHSALPYLAMMAICGIAGVLCVLFGKIVRRDVIFICFFVLFFTWLLNNLCVNNSDYSEIVTDFLYIGIMIMMMVFPMSYTQGIVTFYLSITTFIIGYITGAATHTFLTSSGNYISILVILAASMYYITIQVSGHSLTIIDLLPSLLCFLISVWAKGRAGILCCLILLLLIMLYYIRYYASKNSKRLLFIILIILMVSGYLIIQNVNLIDSFFALGKWAYRGVDTTSRNTIWGAYFDKLKENPFYILIGAPLNNIPIIYALNNNIHNSFLQLHATNGILPFILCIVLFVKDVVYFVKNKKQLLAIVLLVVFIRGMTDKFIFGQYGMPIMMYLLLYPLFDSYISKQAERRLGRLY